MPDRPALPAHSHKVSKIVLPDMPVLRSDHTVTANNHVMGDLNEVVDLRALADNCVLQRAAIDRRC